MNSWRVAGSVGVVIVAVALLLLFPYLVRSDVMLGPRSGLGTDIAYRHWPDLVNYARVLRQEGSIALWDDAVAGGRPLAGDPVVLWLYPFDLFFLFLPPAAAFNWLAALHIALAGLGSYLFLRRGLALSTLPALLGGLAYMLSPKLIAHLAGGHVGLAYGAVWIPWALWGVRLAARGDWRGPLLAGAALALQIPTHVQVPFFTACLMVAYAAWLLLSARPFAERGWRRWLTTAAVLPSFLLLAAAILLPLLGLLPYASRQGFSLQDASWYSLPPLLLATFFSPSAFQFPEWVLYPGAVTLPLAIIALLGRRRGEASFWAGVVVFALLYAIGQATPLFPLLYRVPGFSQMRIPPRIWFVGAFAMPVLAALGAEAAVDAATRPRLARWRPWLRRLVLLVYGGEAAAVLGLVLTGSSPWLTLASLLVALAALALLTAHQRGRLRAQHLLCGLVLLALLELLPTARLYTEGVPVDELLAETPALAYLSQQPGLWRVYSSHGELPYAAAADAGIEAAEGLLALQMGHYVDLVKLASGCTVQGYGTGVPPCLTAETGVDAYRQARPAPALLGLLNVRYVLTSLPYDDPNLEEIGDFGSQRIYENHLWLPRAFVVFQARQMPDPAAVLAALPQIDPARTALLVEPLPEPLDESLPLVPATVTSRSANETEIRVDISRPGLLVVSRTWMPGWQARVDGQPAHLYRVDHALQGIWMPAGEHIVQLRYRPWGWQVGWPISLGAWLLVVVLLASQLGWPRRKKE